ncbi:MAG TPA: MarR family transcriptional regulator [Dehalococcoidales bacterium]|nr:MarR family transcriptional regulator [Dehalococcoidales bacterium]
MNSDNTMKQGSEVIIDRILQLSNDIFHSIRLTIPAEWLTSDMTIAQLRVLLFLYTEGPSSMSTIALAIKISLPTITGTVDLLVKKNLVTRKDDPEDRRLVICSLSPEGQEIINKMWTLGRLQMQKMLQGLSILELTKAYEVAQILLRNVQAIANEF